VEINLDELTFGQIKEIYNLNFFQGETPKPKENSGFLEDLIGEYVIVRSRNEGINAGFLAAADDTGCLLKDCRRIWYHKPKDRKTAWYEGVAESGLHKDSKISCEVISKAIIENYSITLCTAAAKESIREKKPHES